MKAIIDSMIVGLLALRISQGSILRRTSESFLIGIFALSLLAGCSSQSAKTVESEKTVSYGAADEKNGEQPVISEKQTSKTEESSKSDSSSTGLVSGTVHVVGQALALPFRVVGGLIGVIF